MANFFVAQMAGDEMSLPHRTDGKRTDGVTMIPWEMGKQLVWDVAVVDALASSRLNQGSLCNPRTIATVAEARKMRSIAD